MLSPLITLIGLENGEERNLARMHVNKNWYTKLKLAFSYDLSIKESRTHR